MSIEKLTQTILAKVAEMTPRQQAFFYSKERDGFAVYQALVNAWFAGTITGEQHDAAKRELEAVEAFIRKCEEAFNGLKKSASPARSKNNAGNNASDQFRRQVELHNHMEQNRIFNEQAAHAHHNAF